MTTIAIDALSKHYGPVPAVDAASLTIHDGEFMVLVGPSGCGKTTLLRMIAGLCEPTGGRVLFDGLDVTLDAPGQRNVAMVFQNYALFPHMTVERNLSFGLRLRRTGATECRARVAEVARLLRIETLLARFPRELSGGQKQRVALGRALMRRPVAFLFDEPLSNLDPALRVEMRAEIVQLHRRFPVTTVYVTHDQVEAMTMGDRIAVMAEGRLAQVGAPREVYHDPANLFTASFIGSPAVNVLPMAIGAAGTQLVLREPSGGVIFTLDAPLPAAWPEQVLLGIRPEHWQLTTTAAPGALAAEVLLVEELGREHIVHLRRGELSLRCVAPGGSVPPLGALAHLVPQLGTALYFDPATGLRLRLPPAG